VSIDRTAAAVCIYIYIYIPHEGETDSGVNYILSPSNLDHGDANICTEEEEHS
jgi:hypothetical protein